MTVLISSNLKLFFWNVLNYSPTPMQWGHINLMSTPHASTQLAIIVSAVRQVYSGRGDPPLPSRSVTSTFYLFGLAKLPYDTYESLAIAIIWILMKKSWGCRWDVLGAHMMLSIISALAALIQGYRGSKNWSTAFGTEYQFKHFNDTFLVNTAIKESLMK